MRPVLMALSIFLTVSAATTAQAQTDDVARLTQEVADLRARVAQLELRLAEVHALPNPGTGINDAGKRLYAYVDRLENLEAQPTDANAAQIQQLETEINQLEQTMAQVAQSVAQAGSQSINVNTGGGDSQSQREQEARQQAAQIRSQQRSQSVLMSRYREQLARKQAQLRERKEGQTGRRQVIHAHRGDVLLRLESQRDLMDAQDIQPGPEWRIITWEGRLIEADAGSQRWEITRIAPVDPTTVPPDEHSVVPANTP